jgi:ribokinase
VKSAISVLGSLNVDLVQQVPRMPNVGETLAGGDLTRYPGGKGANQAHAAARLGGAVRMFGHVGDGPFGPWLKSHLARAGVDISGIRTVTESTGSALIFVLPDGSNAITIAAGANAAATQKWAREACAACAEGDYLLSQLEIPAKAVVAGCKAARKAGAKNIVDPAPAGGFRESLWELADILTPNESEAIALLDQKGATLDTEDDWKTVTGKLLERGPETVLLTLGARGCFVASGEERVLVPAPAVTPVDTTAAGDTFNGALAVGLAEGMPLKKAVAFANAAAALSTTRHGAQPSAPTRDEVARLVGEG